MILYLDSSALVKRYVQEAGSRALAVKLRREKLPATSRVAYAEVAAAVARRCRQGDITKAGRDRILTRLGADFERYLVVDVSASLMRLIPELVVTHPLRGFDAIHLASALLLAEGGSSAVTFACTDGQLNRAAQASGIAVWDPEDG